MVASGTIGRRSMTLVALTCLTATTLGASVAGAQSPDPSPSPATGTIAGATLWPPGSDPLGVPYEEWAARWWTWVGTVPADRDPGTTDDCQVNQSGPVFFIPHTWPGMTHETTCVVRSDQAILATGGGAYCDLASGWGENEAELRACIDADMDVFSNVSVSVDGEAVPDIDRYWVISPMHDVTFPEGNAFEIEPGTTQAVAAGWFVMISDLEPGTHEIVVHDDVDIPDDDEAPLPAELRATVEVVDAATASPVAPTGDPAAPTGDAAATASPGADGGDDATAAQPFPEPGDLPAGTYESTTLGPRITVTVDDRWVALGGDLPDEGFLLVDEGFHEGRLAGLTVTAYAGEVFADPCDMGSVTALGDGAEAFIGFLADHPALTPTTGATEAEVAEHPAFQIDVTASLPEGCEGVAFLWPLPVSEEFHLADGETARFIALDVGDRTLLIVIEAYPDVEWDTFLAHATEVLESMTIEA
jgi:hypothetical protein